MEGYHIDRLTIERPLALELSLTVSDPKPKQCFLFFLWGGVCRCPCLSSRRALEVKRSTTSNFVRGPSLAKPELKRLRARHASPLGGLAQDRERLRRRLLHRAWSVRQPRGHGRVLRGVDGSGVLPQQPRAACREQGQEEAEG
jgi:hypothetical protein